VTYGAGQAAEHAGEDEGPVQTAPPAAAHQRGPALGEVELHERALDADKGQREAVGRGLAEERVRVALLPAASGRDERQQAPRWRVHAATPLHWRGAHVE